MQNQNQLSKNFGDQKNYTKLQYKSMVYDADRQTK